MRQTPLKTRLSRFAASGLVLAGMAMPASTAMAGDTIYSIDLNKTQILRLPAAAGAIVVGNPSIADVSVHSPMTLFVVGRGFGETNLIILDRDGQTMVDADIQVTATTSSHGTRVFNGGARQSYSCVPYCQPSPVLGDNPEFIGAFSVEASTNQTVSSVFEEQSAQPSTGLQGFDSSNAQAMGSNF